MSAGNYSYNKVLVENHAMDAPFEMEIPDTFRFKNYTIEAQFTGLTYPASENDAEIQLQDGEDEDGSIDYETVDGGFVKLAEGEDRVKMRIVDLNTRNTKIVYAQGSATGGTLTKLTITYQT